MLKHPIPELEFTAPMASPSPDPDSQTQLLQPSWQPRDYIPISSLAHNRCHDTSKAILNVGGVRHVVMWRSLERLRHTRLGRLRASKGVVSELCDDYNPTDNEYYFDRNNSTFEPILALYRTDSLHMPDGVCALAFRNELNYWGVNEAMIAVCCQHRYYERKGRDEKLLEDIRSDEKDMDKHTGAGNRLLVYQKKLHKILEIPNSSLAARVFTVLSILFTLMSIMAVTLMTVDGLRDVDTFANHTVNNMKLVILEGVCVAWFTLEYGLRLIAAPHKYRFLKGALNGIDLAAIVAYLAVLFASAGDTQWTSIAKILLIIRCVRILRVPSKLARHSQGLRVLGLTLTHSGRELGLLALSLAIAILIFSTLAYYAEKDVPNTRFTSIPTTFWWACITMTTVGYGDVVPVTEFGKAVAIVCSMCGVVVIALPIPIMVTKFAELHKNQLRRERAIERRGQVVFNDTAIDELYNKIEFLGTGKTLPDTPETIASFYQYINGSASREHSDLWHLTRDWFVELKSGFKSMYTNTMLWTPSVALGHFCTINTTTAVSVAKGYNSRLPISHLIKDAAIAKIHLDLTLSGFDWLICWNWCICYTVLVHFPSWPTMSAQNCVNLSKYWVRRVHACPKRSALKFMCPQTPPTRTSVSQHLSPIGMKYTGLGGEGK
ncbi:unnamed protein product, partial [Oppiella nova]